MQDVVRDDFEFEQRYAVFLNLIETTTPPAAADQLRLFASEDVVQRIIDRHERDARKVREMDEPRTVYLHNRLTWYTGPRPKDKQWPTLRESLRRKGFDDANIEALDTASTKVVSLIEHPKTPEFDTKGLVVGFVQSGKTTNFTAVMAKAADRHYRLFIVLSGIHNALRRQTQMRLVKDLVEAHPASWHQMTTLDHDFRPTANPTSLLASRDQHVLLVVKKNATVLRKLRNWLRKIDPDHLQNCPTLIIDDEADQSTIATKKINPLLADLLRQFPKVAYIGYTATPFANLLTDPANSEDFYPRDFVVNLPQPKGYYGPEVLFGRQILDGEDAADVPGGNDMIRLVEEDEVNDLRPKSRATIAGFAPSLTESLDAAVRWFWLATAARRVRGGGNPHSSMLIHTSVSTPVHLSFRPLIESTRNDLLRKLDEDDPDLIDELEAQWEDESIRVPSSQFGESPVGFDELLRQLRDVVAATRVVIDNSASTDRLDYESGPVTVIAIGGNTLSRGLTLEGLVSSLFVRGASAYDTLLQMGRWFGYRYGYADLPRIWLTEELCDWFRHLATVEAEMRSDIDRYMVENVNPMTFAVRLRSHPKLMITAKAKMSNLAVAASAYGGQLVETRYFPTTTADLPWLQSNLDAAKQLFAAAAALGRRDTKVSEDRALFRDVDFEVVIEFLNRYRFHEKSVDGDSDRLLAYIRKRVAKGSLTRWSVAVVGSARTADKCDLGSGVVAGKVVRSRLSASDRPADIKTLSSRRDEVIDLDDVGEGVDGRTKSVALRAQQAPRTGLLLLYPIDPTSKSDKPGRSPLNAPGGLDAVIGVALVFPEPPPEEDDHVEYRYYSAKLPPVEEDDVSVLDVEDEDAA